MSALVRPRRPLSAWGWLSLIAGVSVADGLREATGLPVLVKWPNDVMIGEKKVCGILSESVGAPGGRCAILGAGINIANRRDQLPVPTATSLHLEGSDASPAAIAAAVLAALAGWFGRWDAGEDVSAAYGARCSTLGRRVRVHVPGGEVEGAAFGVDDAGRLLVQTEAGMRAFSAGDVVHLRPETATRPGSPTTPS